MKRAINLPFLCKRIFWSFFLLFLGISLSAQMARASSQTAMPRFFLMGDGVLWLQKEKIPFREGEGQYLESGLKRIHQLFGAPWGPEEERLSLRFIEVLDYVQDQLSGGTYWLRSGYRSPQLNQRLRNQGKLAAQSSMHIEGAAGDLSLAGIPSSKVFEFVKNLNCCGIGWYHSKHFHLDTGPARYWDETTSKTEDKRPQQNLMIILQSPWDRYRAGEKVPLQLMRATNYPYGVPKYFSLIKLEPHESEKAKLEVDFPASLQAEHHSPEKNCVMLTNRSQARQLSVTLPEKIGKEELQPGKYAIRVNFCDRQNYERMPEEILSRSFEILVGADPRVRPVPKN